MIYVGLLFVVGSCGTEALCQSGPPAVSEGSPSAVRLFHIIVGCLLGCHIHFLLGLRDGSLGVHERLLGGL